MTIELFTSRVAMTILLRFYRRGHPPHSLGGCHKEPLESVAQSDRTEKPRELRKARGKQWEILIFPIDGASEPSRWFHEKAETT